MISDQWRAEREAISLRLRTRHRARARGEWLDHHCLFHDDHHRSASWNETTGTYYCRTEDRTWTPPEVTERLFLVSVPASQPRPQRSLPATVPTAVYTYLWPDGTPSHLKLRYEPKRFLQSFF